MSSLSSPCVPQPTAPKKILSFFVLLCLPPFQGGLLSFFFRASFCSHSGPPPSEVLFFISKESFSPDLPVFPSSSSLSLPPFPALDSSFLFSYSASFFLIQLLGSSTFVLRSSFLLRSIFLFPSLPVPSPKSVFFLYLFFSSSLVFVPWI